MTIETGRLILREMNEGDYDALYAVLADSDIMRHYPYTFDEKRVREWINRDIRPPRKLPKYRLTCLFNAMLCASPL